MSSIKWIGPYPSAPPRRPSGEGMSKNKHEARQRDRPRLWDCFARWAGSWGADLLLIAGAGCLSAGAGWIYPPAGLIAAGTLLIAGGILWAWGGDGP